MRGWRHGQRHHHRASRLDALDVLVKLLIGGAFAYAVIRVGIWVLRGLATPLPEPPPAGEMRKVNLQYRCAICGVELKMTVAPNEEPAPPRHCQEDMDLVAPVD